MSFDANVPHGDPHPPLTFDPTPAGVKSPLPPGVGRSLLIIRYDDRDDEVIPGVMLVGDSDIRFEADE